MVRRNQLSGIKAEKIVGKKYRKFIYKEDLEIVKDYFAKVLSGEAQYAKFRIIDNRGKIIHIDVTLDTNSTRDNEVIGFYGLTHNISDEQELKHGYSKKRERLQSLIHYSHEMIGILDPDGTIVFESPSIEAILGYKVRKFPGKTFSI